jgi:hypothetical protein
MLAKDRIIGLPSSQSQCPLENAPMVAAWTPERIAELSIEDVKKLRENAKKLASSQVVDLCDADIARRAPLRSKLPPTRATSESRFGQVVAGFHFVCDKGKGVSNNPDGTIWTGTWVVDQAHAERGEKIAAYVALHTTKAEPSYLQGIIRGWRKTMREQQYAEGRPVKIESGIDFLLEPTTEPYQWEGDGAGEKG